MVKRPTLDISQHFYVNFNIIYIFRDMTIEEKSYIYWFVILISRKHEKNKFCVGKMSSLRYYLKLVKHEFLGWKYKKSQCKLAFSLVMRG